MRFLLTILFIANFSFGSELSEIKSELIEKAKTFQGRIDTDGTLQKEIETIVAKLIPYQDNLTMEERALKAVGTWNQIWGPYAFDGSDSIPPGQDIKNIYQYISPHGYYYNFAEYVFLGKRFRTYLRGNYQIERDRINVEFNETGIIREDVNYITAGEKIENGKIKVFRLPRNLPPVGIGGALEEVYADEDLRVNYGTIGDDLSTKSIFTMQRVK